MATVTAEINLTSAAGDLVTDALSLADSTTITVSDMATTGLARTKVTSTSGGGAGTTLYTASDFAAPAYLYVKNTDVTPGDYIFVYDDTTSGDPVILKLAGGDWAFLPLNAGLTLKAYATTNPTLVEWMVFGTDA